MVELIHHITTLLLQRPTLQWRHNERDCVSNHQPHDCLLNLLFRRRSKKTSKLCVTGLCEWNLPVTGEFPAQKARNAEFDDVVMTSPCNRLHLVCVWLQLKALEIYLVVIWNFRCAQKAVLTGSLYHFQNGHLHGGKYLRSVQTNGEKSIRIFTLTYQLLRTYN